MLVAALRWLALDSAPGVLGVTLDGLFTVLFASLVYKAGGSRCQLVAAVSTWVLLFQVSHVLKLMALGSPVFFSDLSMIEVLLSVLDARQAILAVTLMVLVAGVLLYGVWPSTWQRLPWTLMALLLPVGLYFASPWETKAVDLLSASRPNDHVTHLQERGGMQFLLDQRARKYELGLNGREMLNGRQLHERPQLAARRNVHLVLLETFWDPLALKAYQFSRDPFDPRFRALLNQGNNSGVLTPHFGHLTANAEFEALCGLPATEDAVFQNRLKDTFPCLPRILREVGYETLASHSNKEESWGRNKAYRHIGFSGFNAYASFVRDDLDGVFLNDASFYRQNSEVLARHDRGTPYLNYLVTISSHYPYELNSDQRPAIVKVKPSNEIVANYANAIAYSSKAFMDWFEQVRRDDPDALIVAFGDHAPTMPPDQKPYVQSGINTNARPFRDADTLLAMSRTPLVFVDGRKGAVDMGTIPLEYLPIAITRALGVLPEGLPYLADDMSEQRARDSTRFLGNILTRHGERWRLCEDHPADGTPCAEAVQLYDRKRALRNALLASSQQMFASLGGGWMSVPTAMQIGSGECLLEVSDWGPRSARVGEQFNLQKASGLSATWLRIKRIQGSPQLRIGAVSTPVVGSGEALAALWPAPGVILQAGNHPVDVVCGNRIVGRLGQMRVEGAAADPALSASTTVPVGPLRVEISDEGLVDVVARAKAGACENGEMRRAQVTVNWRRASGDDDVRVFVQQGDEDRKLWSVSGPSGGSTTGPWADDGMKLWFEDMAGAPLGVAVVTAPACASAL